MKSIFTLVFSLVSFVLIAQNAVAITEDFTITIANQTNKVPEYVDVEIQNFNFKSEEDMMKFCRTFSMDFHKMTPSWSQQKLRIQFNQTILNEKGYTLQDLNAYFTQLAPRMLYIYSNL